MPQQFFDADGNPLALGKVQTFVAGTTTPIATFANAELTVSNPVEIDLDAEGCPETPIFQGPTYYKLRVFDADDVEVSYSPLDGVGDAGQVFAANTGIVLATGGRDVNSGYTELLTDRLVTTDGTDSSSPFIFNLLPVASVTVDLTIVHFGTGALSCVPNGADTVNGVAAAYSVPAGTSPDFPSITLRPDGSNWLVVARAN